MERGTGAALTTTRTAGREAIGPQEPFGRSSRGDEVVKVSAGHGLPSGRMAGQTLSGTTAVIIRGAGGRINGRNAMFLSAVG